MRSRLRSLMLATAVVAIAAGATTAVLVLVDMYLHTRYERSAGFNLWGYRGPSVGSKKPGEYRVAVLGGSAAYGYGVSAEEAIPAVLERLLRRRALSATFTVVNLGYNNEGAYSFKTTLNDYAWLRYDLALLYEGYNDLSQMRPNLQVFRHESPVFRLTGYLPIFPIIFREKAAAMVSGGNPGAFYRSDQKTTFHASLATRTGASVLTATAAIATSLETQLGRVASEPPARIDDDAHTGCGRWSAYCRSIEVAIQTARGHRAQVMVATQPYLRAGEHTQSLHMDQQAALREFLSRRFGADSDVTYVNLGDAVDLEDSHLSFDHMHLDADGNAQVAAAFVEPVLAMAARKRS